MRQPLVTAFAAIAAVMMSGPVAADTADGDALIGQSWDTVVEMARGGEVNWFLWGGSDNINRYVSEYIGGILAEDYDITLNRVGLNDTVEGVNIILSEVEAGVTDKGSIDLIWINGENFKTIMQADLAFCGYFETLPNNRLIDWDNPSVANDFGLPVNGCESPWTRGKGFIYGYDPQMTQNPPRSIAELIDWVEDNPGQFTYVAPPDFQGSAFVRHVFYHAAGGIENIDPLLGDFDQALFDEIAGKTWDILNGMEPHLWRQGETYPTSQAQLADMFANSEVALLPSYDAENVSLAVSEGKFADSVRTFGMKDGGIANTSYIMIPANSPNKAAAMVAQNVLLSAEAHYQKALPDVWGSNPAIEMDRADPEIQAKYNAIDWHPSFLSERDPDGVGTLPEMNGEWLAAVEKGWQENVARK